MNHDYFRDVNLGTGKCASSQDVNLCELFEEKNRLKMATNEMDTLLERKRERGLQWDLLNTVCKNIDNLLLSVKNKDIVKEELVKLKQPF